MWGSLSLIGTSQNRAYGFRRVERAMPNANQMFPYTARIWLPHCQRGLQRGVPRGQLQRVQQGNHFRPMPMQAVPFIWRPAPIAVARCPILRRA